MLAGMVMMSCGVKKRVPATPSPEPSAPAWHTCLIQGARGTIITSDERVSAAVTMQTVHDSMLVISVMPLLGMEMLRVEATPLELTVIDKMHGQYAVATYAELNSRLVPSLNWDILQQLCTAELPTGNEKARLLYEFNGDPIELVVEYVPRQLDVPVRVVHQPTNRYSKLIIESF